MQQPLLRVLERLVANTQHFLATPGATVADWQAYMACRMELVGELENLSIPARDLAEPAVNALRNEALQLHIVVLEKAQGLLTRLGAEIHTLETRRHALRGYAAGGAA
ncbi:MAG TPA: hypothetical protein VFA15_09530, partial [Nitrososphaera sp.]|nr:hypothetical protein [Nitrososphaera sp.]